MTNWPLGLKRWALKCPLMKPPTEFEEVYSQIERLGAVTGHVDEAAMLVDGMRAEIAASIDAVSDDHEGLTYYHELDSNLYTTTSKTFIGQVYSLFGLVNVADAADPDGSAFGYPQLSYEYLLDADPDIIFIARDPDSDPEAERIADRAGWDQLTAVQSGRGF